MVNEVINNRKLSDMSPHGGNGAAGKGSRIVGEILAVVYMVSRLGWPPVSVASAWDQIRVEVYL